MLKKKLLYREDKNNLKRIKSEDDAEVSPFEPFEDSKYDLPARGRQLTAKTVTITKKNLANTSKTSQNHPNSTNSISSKVMIQNQSKSARTDSKHVEEEYESSDSGISLKNKKRRELFEDSIDLPKRLLNIYKAQQEALEDSQELEKYEISNDFLFNCEEKLTDEIERILIDIYNNHISFNPKKKLDISKYQKDLKFFSKTLNKQYNIFILQILSEKIKELINRYKEKIFEIPEIRQIRDRYFEVKAILVGYRNEEENLVKKKKKKINNDESVNRITANAAIPHSPNKKINNDNKKSKIEFNEPDKSVTKILLLELRNIKKSLIESSKDIENVFQGSFSHLKINNKIVLFSIEEIHREEFTNTLIEDEFISALIVQIKTISRQLKIEEINQLISQIEEDLYSTKKEMTRFTNFLISQQKSFIESDYEDDEESNHDRSSSSDKILKHQKNVTELKNISLNSISKNYTTNNTSNDNSSSPKNKIANDIGIDELVEYIEKTDESKIKKNKKKLKKKKKENLSQTETESKNLEEIDPEIENFKKLITENSKSAMYTRKIRPIISREWLCDMAKLVNVKH